MATLRIATFNVENLFARFKFKEGLDPQRAILDGWKVDATLFDVYDEAAKQITGQAIRALNADVLALQEVENLDVLKRFRNQYLGGRKAYPHAVLLDGNDCRLIDIALLSREDHPILHVRSYQHLRDEKNRRFIFSRDCLEVDVQLPDLRIITVYVNHFKSMLDREHPRSGRQVTRSRRQEQAGMVKHIVAARFGENAGQQPWVVLGDLNDYLETDAQGETGIAELVGWDQVENVLTRLPEEDRWTHFYEGDTGRHIPPAYHQLDYLLLSQSLAEANAGQLPQVERRGLPLRADRYSGSRFEGVGQHSPKASDHCPVWMEIEV